VNGKLLDTNAVIALQAKDAAMLKFLDANIMFVPSIVIGELYYGAYKSGRVQANLKVIEEFADSNTVLTCDKTTARLYGAIRQQLKIKGRPVPENEIWIAAIARQYELTLVTRDEHFRQIDELLLEAW
jgi:tRNA(fMet)-specific endonuclease VapC